MYVHTEQLITPIFGKTLPFHSSSQRCKTCLLRGASSQIQPSWLSQNIDIRGCAVNQLPRSLQKRVGFIQCSPAASSLCLHHLCACRSRSEPAPSPKTRTRVMTTPATASSFIWMQATRFLLSWMGAKLTGATATNTARSQGSSSMPTEGGRRRLSGSPRTVGF